MSVYYILTVLGALSLVSCGVKQQEAEVPALYLPDDLTATLWAESPMLYNPTNIDVDARGRLWVTEAVNYRNFNNDSTRARHHSLGDRVVILEDTDGDGRADVSKVFVQDKDLRSPLGIAVFGNRVYVSCSPHLIVYTDVDGDDVADKKEILLTGFGGIDHDHSLHAVVGGPDGNLYFNTGNAGPHVVTDKLGWTLRSGSVYTGGTPYNDINQGNMRSDDGKVWVGGLALRMNSRGEHLRVLAHNFRNSFELFVDSQGDIWQNDNDDQVVACRTTWVMEGGNAGYFSADGTRYWQADQRPWQNVFDAHWHQDDPGVMPAGDNAGAGSPTGVVVNEGDALGSRYRGIVLSADAGRNVVFAYRPGKYHSGYDLGERRNFITSLPGDNTGYVWNDSAGNAQPVKWFRPSDVAFGTDGALYIADWYDPVVGGHQMRDTVAYGRIYRITPKGRELNSPKIDLRTVEGQIEALKSPAVNVRYTGFNLLRNRGGSILKELRTILDAENPYHRARAIWLMAQLGEAGIGEVVKLLASDDDQVRIVAFRALRQVAPDSIVTLSEKLLEDPSAWVRREVIVALADVPFAEKHALLLKLVDGYSAEDRWYLEALGASVSGYESEFYSSLKQAFYVGEQSPDTWDPKFASLVWRLHPSEAAQPLKFRALSADLDEHQRSQAITALAFINTREAVQAMIDLSNSADSFVAERATYWVTFRQGNEWNGLRDWSKSGIDLAHARAVTRMKNKLNRLLDGSMPVSEKRVAIRDLARDSTGVHMLLGIIAEGSLPRDLYPFAQEMIRKHGDEKVKFQAAAYFEAGTHPTAYRIERIDVMKGDRMAGKETFASQCMTCHRVGNAGARIGPDLSSIGSKYDRKTLLEAIVTPDAGIVFGYQAWTVTLTDGRSYFGFLVTDGEETATIRDLIGKDHVIPTTLISFKKRHEKSLMPSPRVLGLSEQDVADITSYLIALD